MAGAERRTTPADGASVLAPERRTQKPILERVLTRSRGRQQLDDSRLLKRLRFPQERREPPADPPKSRDSEKSPRRWIMPTLDAVEEGRVLRHSPCQKHLGLAAFYARQPQDHVALRDRPHAQELGRCMGRSASLPNMGKAIREFESGQHRHEHFQTVEQHMARASLKREEAHADRSHRAAQYFADVMAKSITTKERMDYEAWQRQIVELRDVLDGLNKAADNRASVLATRSGLAARHFEDVKRKGDACQRAKTEYAIELRERLEELQTRHEEHHKACVEQLRAWAKAHNQLVALRLEQARAAAAKCGGE
mmetsp:Transcript_38983/g.107315  ORF Transcript_38983/g.107315 Transcript_38983/m.107315 type:complete len:310 (+) Transcript_38983:52-981(+)